MLDRLRERLSWNHDTIEVKCRMFVLATLGIFRRRTGIERFGSSYGGWIIPQGLLNNESLVVSVGVGEDTTFDEAIGNQYGCRIVGVDPTPRAAVHVEGAAAGLGRRFSLMSVALSGADGEREFYAPRLEDHVSYSLVHRSARSDALTVRTVRLSTLMRMLGETGRDIQLLKLDIEGAECEVVADVVRHGPFPQAICVEFDRRGAHHLVRNFVRLVRGGYRLVAVEGLNATFVRTDRAPHRIVGA